MNALAYVINAGDISRAIEDIWYDSRNFPGITSRKLETIARQARKARLLRSIRAEIPSIGNRHNRRHPATVRYLASVGL